MELLNSGDSTLELWDEERGWISFMDAYLREATEYKLRVIGNRLDVHIQGIPLPFYQQHNGFYATLITPFQSGVLTVKMDDHVFETYIYPDHRKLTEEQFNLMLEEILEEANICFQLSGLQSNVTASGRSRNINWTQWCYIDRSFFQLKQIFTKIEKQPIQRLEKHSVFMKREKVQGSEQVALRWLDQKGHGEAIPRNVQNDKSYETRNVYENQVLKQLLQDLHRLLRKYENIEHGEIPNKAAKYKAIIQRWINSTLLKEIVEHKGSYTITQKFRKHPVYRLWYQWFDRLYKHNQEKIGFDYPISLKDTFQLYEMWCYIKIVKILREASYVSDTSDLFRITKNGIFLNLAENKESKIKLHRGLSLYYQRSYQYDSKCFYTYTQRMIPDIVLEGEKEIIVFDPKYRVPDNLGMALGEMHKYRDGILHRETGKRAIKEVYIITPTNEEKAVGKRYFHGDFHKMFNMGAFQLVPGGNDEAFRERLCGLMRSFDGFV